MGDALDWAFKILPSYCLTDVIMFDAGGARLQLIRPDLKESSNFALNLVGGNILVMCLHFIFWSLVLVFIELGAFNWTRRILGMLAKNVIRPKEDAELKMDDDVIAEEERVERT